MATERTYYVICEDKCLFESMTKEQIVAAIAEATGSAPTDVDAAFITKIKEQNAGKELKFWIGTQAQYNAIAEPVEDVLYLITDNGSDTDAAAKAEIDDLKQALTKAVNDLTPIYGEGAPTTSTAGAVGQAYITTSQSSGLVYYCTAVNEDGTYTWISGDATLYKAVVEELISVNELLGTLVDANLTMEKTSAPTSSTVGYQGKHYIDTSTGAVYICTAANDDKKTYTWTALSKPPFDVSDKITLTPQYEHKNDTTIISKNYVYDPQSKIVHFEVVYSVANGVNSATLCQMAFDHTGGYVPKAGAVSDGQTPIGIVYVIDGGSGGTLTEGTANGRYEGGNDKTGYMNLDLPEDITASGVATICASGFYFSDGE